MADSNRLVIEYIIKTDQADAQAEAFDARQAAREKRTQSVAEDAEASKAKSAGKTAQARTAAALKVQEAEEEASRRSVSGAERQASAWKGVAGAIQGGTTSAVKFAASMAGIQGLGSIVGTFAEHWQKIREDAARAAADVQRMRGDIRELQALRGELGKTGPGIAHVFDIARETLQTPDQVKEMESAGLGIGELALRNDRDRAEFTKAMIAAGRFQQLEGGDAGAYGQMMGQIALQAKGPIDSAQMEAQAYKLYQIQAPGGFRNMSQAMGQYGKLNGLVQNGVYTPEEAMSLASAFSVSSPEEAATRTEQFTRSVMAGRIKSRGMQVSSDVDLMKTDEYFKSLGIGENDSAIARGKKIANDIARRQAEATKAGGQFNAYEYLMTKGFANQEDRLAIMDFAGLRNNGRLEKIEQAAAAPLERDAISKRFAERRAKDPYLQGRAAELSEQAASVQTGLAEEPLITAQRAAFARLKQQGNIQGSFEDWRANEAGMKGFVLRGIEDVFMGGYHHQVNAEAQRALQAERQRLGLPQYGTFQGSEYETMKRSAREVQQSGGDVTRGVADDLQAAAKSIRNATEAMEQQAQRRNPLPPPMPSRPGPFPTRP